MGESHIVEYKSIWKDEWLQWICGYANAEGGVLYIGLTDEGAVVGLQNVKKLMEDIPNKIVSKMNIYPDVRQLSRGGKDIIEIEVYPSQEGITLDGVLYKRVGATNQVLKGTALKEFYERKMKATWDSRIIPGATLNEIDPDAIKYFLMNGIDKERISKESINDSTEKALRNLELMNAEGQLTIAALLLFGKNPQQYCLNSRIKIGRFGENQGALMAQDLVGGDLIRIADRVMNELSTKYLIHPIHYNRMHREDLEVPAIVEEFGGVRVIIKREVFYAIKHGGRIDSKTGRLAKMDDIKVDTNNVTKKLTERQKLICEMLRFDDIDNVTKKDEFTTTLLSNRFGKDVRTIKRDMKVLKELGLVEHVGPSNGGYWKRLK